MDPIFIYNNNLIFDENQRFILNFRDGDILKGVNFSKENDYYIMSMPCFTEVSNDITKLKQCGDVKKKSIIANRYIKNGIDYGFDSPKIENIFDNKIYQFEINKMSHRKAVDVFFIFMTIYLKEKDLQLFILRIKILMKMGSLTKQKTNPTILEVKLKT